MSGADPGAAMVPAAVLDRFCPMHVIVGPTGHIRGGGSTLARLVAPSPLIGARFLELFELIRPRCVQSMDALRDLDGARLRLRLRARPRYPLKGVISVLPSDGATGGGGVILNLAFGISVADAVREFGLTGADFAATDLTTEMLYLLEAKSVAMEESRRLTHRLDGARRDAQHQALTDTLTGLRNRRAFEPILAQALHAGGPFALLHLDLDFFKDVNDTHGHAAGDLVLRVAAQRMLATVRHDDVIARVGGDEFVLLLPGIDDWAVLAAIADRLIAALEAPISDGTQAHRVSASLGGTLSRDHDPIDAGAIMAAADAALYAAKAGGRGCHALHRPDKPPAAMPLPCGERAPGDQRARGDSRASGDQRAPGAATRSR